ncbi:MAG: diacylglycerol kinase family protein [Firmicutes bacterium]|nr:diacylglycerol kinase family protein [Bacillota bacterium]
MKLFARRYKHEKKTVKGTLKNALEGINYTYNSEINLRLHFLAAVVVFVVCFILGVSIIEWAICILLIGLVIALELINTVVEVVVDLVQPKYDPLAKIAKDTASGAVLVMAITAAIIGLIILLPKALVFIGLI